MTDPLIDRSAPLVGRAEALIAAPIDRVWAVLADIDAWPEWQAPVSHAALEGPLAPGSAFRWKAKGMAIASTLEVVDPPHRIAWTGRALGMRAVHVWTLRAQGEGTRVVTEESLGGWLARLVGVFDRGFVDRALAEALAALKEDTENP